MRVLHGLKLSISISLVLGLIFAGGLFSLILYAKITDSDLDLLVPKTNDTAYASSSSAEHTVKQEGQVQATVSPPPKKQIAIAPRPQAARLSAPALSQYPQLPAGCEITSLAMLLQYAGIKKDKMELLPELAVDPTPIRFGKTGEIVYWGNPNTGFVGDITRKKIGFGIYHSGLFGLLKKNMTSGIDMTGKKFEEIENQLIQGIPVVVWTTTDFNVPVKWVKWDTPVGPFRTTFSEHAVLLVGFDSENVYVNDPLSGKKDLKIGKERFLATWDALGKQALSYTKAK